MTESGVFQAFNAAVAAIRSEMQAGFTSIHERIDAIHGDRVAEAQWKGGITQDVKAAHRRIGETQEEIAKVEDRIDEAHGPGIKGWAAILITLITAAAGVATALLSSERKTPDSAAHAKEGK